MGKATKGGSGFSTVKPAVAPQQQCNKSSADQTAKEQQAFALINQGKLEEAEAIYRELIGSGTSSHIVFGNLAAICGMQGRFTELIDLLTKTLELRPNNPDAHNNLGNALMEQGDLNAAIASYNIALQLKPNYPEAHNNLGVAFQEQGDLNAAIDSFNKALGLKPNYPDAHFNSSLIMLLGGDYKNGWQEYEWRAKREKNTSKPHALPKCDRWSGKLAPKTISQLLLVTEQGLGDTLQFMRYAIALRNQDISVSLCAQSKLHSLIKASGIDPSPLTPQQANEVGEGQWIPLLSVPRHLEVSQEKPIITAPYIKTTAELSDKWQGILSTEKRPIIGINWQGNPETEKTGLRCRSLALETFAEIIKGTQISLLSLQKGFGSEQMESCSFKEHFVSCQEQINDTWDFLETAAIIANCDLVITSDTSVAHLAGGMGKATWLLLHKIPDWRWGLEGETTFWYPSMRLFRQRERGNWNEVLERVAEALQEKFPGISAGDSGSAQLKQVEETYSARAAAKSLQEIQAPISLGELIDKITILEIKTQRLQGSALENVQKELAALEETLNALDLQVDPKLIQRLMEVNADLWQIEDAIRDQERQKCFGETFIHLARSVYQQNDRRAAIKKEIDTTYGSALVEEKAYQGY